MTPCPPKADLATFLLARSRRQCLGLNPEDICLINSMQPGDKWAEVMTSRLDYSVSSATEILEAVVDLSLMLRLNGATWAGLFQAWRAAGSPALVGKSETADPLAIRRDAAAALGVVLPEAAQPPEHSAPNVIEFAKRNT